MKKKIILLTLVVFLSFAVCYGYGEIIKKVKITSALANIRNSASIKGKVLITAKNGDIFEFVSNEGKWYKIILSVDEKGEKKYGFVHSSIAERIEINKDSQKEENKVEKVETPIVEKKNNQLEKTEVITKTEEGSKKSAKSGLKIKQNRLFSGFYLKGGWLSESEVSNFSEKWIASFGFDIPIGKFLTWGLEFEPYYRTTDFANVLSFKNIYLNVFANLKIGINLGVITDKLSLLTLYGGGGLGTNLNYEKVESGITNYSDSSFKVYFAWHIVYGFEINLKSVSLILEFQENNIVDPKLEPKTQNYGYILFGIRF